MNYKILIDNKQIDLEIPLDKITIIEPEKVPVFNQEKLVYESLQNPIDSPDLKTFLQNKENILIIVNDGSRNTPTEIVLSTLYEQIKNKNFKFIVALGTHRLPTKPEFDRIFGKFYHEFKDRIFCHDSQNDEMTYLGKTSYGTPVKISSEVTKAEGVIIISSVEPHYFAGFTGGRKSYLPGVSAYGSIEKNHSLALRDEAKILKLDGNPVHEDMTEAAKMVTTETFCTLTVLDTNDKIFYAASGNIHSTLKAASKRVIEIFAPEVKEKADIVIAINQSPLNRNLYQSQKGLENCKSILKENGIFILVSSCNDGIGNKAFYELMASCKSPDEVFNKVEDNYKLGYHKAAKFVSFMKKNKLWMVSELDSDELENIFIKNFSTLQIALNKAIMLKGKDAKLNIVKNAGITVPRINGLK
ncbi:MAG: nickel-dependent lactate racemase [Candidatus Tenebribacter davisii]|nr:nickel-dependent lactate racemase [Candidatus Tenebribacter davisii]